MKMRSAVLALLLLAPAAWAELAIYAVVDGAEQPLGSFYNLGKVAAGDTLVIDLRVRNPGPGAVQITRFTADGVGFSLELPVLPFTIQAGNFARAQLVFRGDMAAMYSANLQLNGISVIVAATVVPAPLLTVFPVCTGTNPNKIDFGSVEFGKLRLCNFNLQNASAEAMTISTFAVTGDGFSGPMGRTAPFTLAAGETTSFVVHFVPPRAGSFTGALKIEAQTYVLSGTGLNPPLPKPVLDLESAPLASAQQRRLTMRLPEPAPFDATGQVQLSFTPDSTVVSDDPAVMFTVNGARSIAFTVQQGSAEVLLGGQPFAMVQTGTSAGRMKFTLSGIVSGFASDPTTLFTIPPRTLALDTIDALLGFANVDVRMTGFDNTYSAGAMSFTFYDAAGKVIGGGPVRADFSGAFRAFYSSTKAGSAFQVTVSFPVAGDATAVGSVEVELSNAAGTTRTDRLTFH